MSKPLANQKTYDDEISLKEVIQTFMEYFWHILRSWKFIALMVILSVVYNVYKAISHDTRYIAPITFMVNEDESSALGGISSLLGSFGSLLGGGGSEFNLDKILEISKSNRLGSDILLEKIQVNGKEDYLANHLIISKDTLQEWVEIGLLDRILLDKQKMDFKKAQKAYRFTVDTLNFEDILQTSVVKKCYTILFGDTGTQGIVDTDYGELTGIMKLTTESYNDKLSIAITNSLFTSLKEFYINNSIEKQKQTYMIMKSKHDSIQSALNYFDGALANYEDTQRGLFREKDKLKKDQLKRKIGINTLALGEAKKNLEIADFALRDKTPFVQVIDEPFRPLKNSQPNLILSIIIGGMIGGILGTFIVVARKAIQNIMK